MARYGKTAQSKVKKAMHERKQGTLKSGRSGRKVTSRKQAIAIGLSEARKAGGKVPKKRASASRKSPSSRNKSSGRKTAARKSSSRRTTVRKTSSRKTSGRKSPSRRKSTRKS